VAVGGQRGRPVDRTAQVAAAKDALDERAAVPRRGTAQPCRLLERT